jgi:hypothetical protein
MTQFLEMLPSLTCRQPFRVPTLSFWNSIYYHPPTAGYPGIVLSRRSINRTEGWWCVNRSQKSRSCRRRWGFESCGNDRQMILVNRSDRVYPQAVCIAREVSDSQHCRSGQQKTRHSTFHIAKYKKHLAISCLTSFLFHDPFSL